MRVVCKVERVVIVRFELDLVLGLDVIRLARHDGGRSVAEYVLMKRRSSRSEQGKRWWS